MELLIEQAKKCLENDLFQAFAQALYAGKTTKATELAQSNLWSAEEVILDSVYKDECDFVLMDHYKKSKDLLTNVGVYIRLND